MDFLSLLRTLGALGVVLGMLAGALWAVRRFDIRLPGGIIGGGSAKRLTLVERLPIDGRRSLALIRKDDREHLVMIAPEGLLLLDAAAAPRTPAQNHQPAQRPQPVKGPQPMKGKRRA